MRSNHVARPLVGGNGGSGEPDDDDLDDEDGHDGSGEPDDDDLDDEDGHDGSGEPDDGNGLAVAWDAGRQNVGASGELGLFPDDLGEFDNPSRGSSDNELYSLVMGGPSAAVAPDPHADICQKLLLFISDPSANSGLLAELTEACVKFIKEDKTPGKAYAMQLASMEMANSFHRALFAEGYLQEWCVLFGLYCIIFHFTLTWCLAALSEKIRARMVGGKSLLASKETW